MEDVDGFNPGTEVATPTCGTPVCATEVGLNYAADLARLGNAAWRGLPLEALQRPGSFLARQVPQFLACWKATATTPTGPTNCPT